MRFSAIVLGLVGLSMAATTAQELEAQGVAPSALLPATTERLDLDRTWAKKLADQETDYNEKRRVDSIKHEKDQLDAYEAETRERSNWEKKAIDAANAPPGGKAAAAAAVHRGRLEWEGKVAFDRSQRELAWDARRDHEEREHEDRRQSQIEEWKIKNRELRAREAREYAERARKTWEEFNRPPPAAAAPPPPPAAAGPPPPPAAAPPA